MVLTSTMTTARANSACATHNETGIGIVSMALSSSSHSFASTVCAHSTCHHSVGHRWRVNVAAILVPVYSGTLLINTVEFPHLRFFLGRNCDCSPIRESLTINHVRLRVVSPVVFQRLAALRAIHIK